VNHCNEKAGDKKSFDELDELERRLRTGLRREAQNVRLDAAAFWSRLGEDRKKH